MRRPHDTRSDQRKSIGAKVRALRTARGLKQSELAGRLGLSQARLSELERGLGSFTAEHLLAVLRLFNVDVSEFEARQSDSASLQNALARHGARHLRVSPEALVAREHNTPAGVILAVLLRPTSERFVTALAPALVWSIDDISLPALQNDFVQAGVPHRLPWLLENVRKALGKGPPLGDRHWRHRWRRTTVVVGGFLKHVRSPPAHDSSPDPFDPGIRSPKSQTKIWSEASPISRRWRVVSALRVSDFEQALGDAIAY